MFRTEIVRCAHCSLAVLIVKVVVAHLAESAYTTVPNPLVASGLRIVQVVEDCVPG